MSRRVTRSAPTNQVFGSQLWFSGPATTTPASRATTANTPRPAIADGRSSTAAGSAGSTTAAVARAQVVGDDILTERTLLRQEQPAAVATADLAHELDEARIVV